MNSLKKVIAIIIIISIVIILDIILENNTKNVVNKMEESLEEVSSLLYNDKITEDKVEDATKEWKKMEDVAYCYVDHNEIEKISNKVRVLKEQVKAEAYSDAKQSVVELKFMLGQLKNKQSLCIENFF